MKKSTLFILMFLFFSIASYVLLDFEKRSKIEQYLNDKTKQYMQEYGVLYEEHKEISSIIFETKINVKEVKDIFKKHLNATKQQKDAAREELYNELKEVYALLRKHNIKQLHFHLPDNESFIRFHRPKKYGDNLTGIRQTVQYVNSEKKPIDGFEEGRIYNGYRFVYPLSDQNSHLGSVEVSFSTLAMNLEFMENFDVVSNFLIAEDVVKQKVFKSEKSNYVRSPFEGFVLEKKMYDAAMAYSKGLYKDFQISEKTNDALKHNIKNDFSFSIYDEVRRTVLTFITVKNPVSKKVVGIFVVESGAKYMINKGQNFYMLFAGVVLLIALFFLFIYRIINEKDILNKKVEEKTSILVQVNKELERNKQELYVLNENLEHKVQEEVYKNREKDKMMSEQTKMAALGEMIGNIAHHWRQPLSVITASISGMQLQKELAILDDEKFNEVCCEVNKQAQYLSNTIDDFRNFIKGESIKNFFNLKQSVNTFLTLVKSSIKNHRITVETEIDESISINGYQNELNQCLVNLFNNSREALDNNVDERERYINIAVYKKDNDLIIVFKDNGGGIPDSIIDRIFEPYFTTKHQSQGTGLGLHVVYKLVVNMMGGTVTASNDTCTYKDKEYKCAKMVITLPLT